MQLDDLEVRFRRSSGNLPAPAALPPPVAAAPPAMPVPPMSAPMGGGDDAVMYSTDDEDVSFSTVSVLSQKVGVFRRCRYVGTKQVGKSPMITEGTGVKTGQPMGYVEQLGTFNPVEVCLVASCGAVLVHECPSCVRLSVCPSVCLSMCFGVCVRVSLSFTVAVPVFLSVPACVCVNVNVNDSVCLVCLFHGLFSVTLELCTCRTK